MVRWVNHAMPLAFLAIFAVELRCFVRSWWFFVFFVFQIRARTPAPQLVDRTRSRCAVH